MIHTKIGDIESFIDIIINYFSLVDSKNKLDFKTPYLANQITPHVLPHTTRITISGDYMGYIYFTSDLDLMNELINITIKEETDLEDALDKLGEIGNILSGNAREFLGPQFNISVPYYCSSGDGIIEQSDNTNSFVIPFLWGKHRAKLIINYQPKSTSKTLH